MPLPLPARGVRPVRPIVLVSCWLLALAVSAFDSLLFLPSGIWADAMMATEGFLGPGLWVAWPMISLLGFALVILAGMRPRELGWSWRALVVGLLWILALWLAVNLVTLGVQLVREHPIQLARSWRETPLFATGNLFTQMAGVALLDETLFRGLFLVQLVLLIRSRGSWCAVVVAALLATLTYAPGRVVYAGPGVLAILADLGEVTLWGVAFGWAYLRTGNLFFVVGVHSLVNAPSLALATEMPRPWLVVAVLAGLIALLWPRIHRHDPTPGEPGPGSPILSGSPQNLPPT